MSESILQGVGQIIDESLGLKDCGVGKEPHYHHGAICQKLTASPPTAFDAADLIQKLYEKIVSNWKEGIGYSRSTQNWRFESCTNLAEDNKSPEVRLERAIVRTQTQPPMNWANQVPTSSGFLGQHADKHRNIDLVHRCEDGAFELIELKVETNTPLYAAMEILQNAVLYIFYREKKEHFEADSAKPKPILDARVIHLRVLAPCSYYKDYELAWLEANICNGLKTFLAKQMPELQMDFRFDVFPASFTADHARAICTDLSKEQAELIWVALDNRERLTQWLPT